MNKENLEQPSTLQYVPSVSTTSMPTDLKTNLLKMLDKSPRELNEVGLTLQNLAVILKEIQEIRGVDMVKDIRDFHEKFGLAYNGPPQQLPNNVALFRLKFLQEELKEFEDGYEDKDDEKMLDALVDLVYVAIGTAHMAGWDFREAWRRVHRANMLKVRAQKAADSKRGSTYDVVKPVGWAPPSLKDLVEQ